MDKDKPVEQDSQASADSTDTPQDATQDADQDTQQADTGTQEPPQQEETTTESEAESEQSEAQPEQRQTRGDKRFQNLTRKLRQSSQETDYWRSQAQPEYKPIQYEDGEYDVNQLEQDRQQYAQTQYQRGKQESASEVKQEMWTDRLEIDGERVAQKYSILDEDSEEFDPDLTSTINEMYLATVGYDERNGLVRNPNVRYRDYVEAYMKAVDRVATSRNADTAKNVAQQSSRGGIRPSGQSRKGLGQVGEGTVANMSPEEYEANKGAINAELKRQLGI